MIHVLASIYVKEGGVSEFVEIFKSNVPAVLAEDGCIAYAPAMDVATGLAPQEVDGNVVTIIEKWESVDALRAHLVAPHMVAYQGKVKDLVEKVSIKVLEEV